MKNDTKTIRKIKIYNKPSLRYIELRVEESLSCSGSTPIVGHPHHPIHPPHPTRPPKKWFF